MDSVEEMDKGHAIEIEFDPMLSEEVVLYEINKREQMGDGGALEDYHERVDPLYGLPSRQKLKRIKDIHTEFFVDFGFEGIFKEILTEFPLIQDKIKKIYVIRAIKEEVADLTTDDESQNEELAEQPNTILVKLSSESFSNVEHLGMVMKHELMHVQDMLDEEFGYKPFLPSLPPLERTLVTDKYRVIWDIYIDTRLLRDGKKTVSNKDTYYREFKATYLNIPQLERAQVFEGLWAMETITHDEIVELAKDANKLLARFTDRKEKIFLPGTPCPLCKFPTYHWMDSIGERVDEKVIKGIQRDFPDWNPSNGACERCIEVYQAHASLSLQNTVHKK